jgi:sporulation protein YlmC with PRC-barrel domain
MFFRTRMALAVPVAMALAGGAAAQQQTPDTRQPSQQRPDARSSQTTREQAEVSSERAVARAAADARLFKANQLIGMNVENRRSENIGRIEQIILDESQNRVQYVVLSFGGWMGIGNKLFAVPFQSFEFQPDDRLLRRGTAILDIPQERLRDAPGFDRNRYPDVANPEFARDVEEFYGRFSRPGQRERAWDRDRREDGDHWSQDWQQWRLRAVSRVVGSDIEDPQGRNIGNVEDIVIDEREGRLVYAIVSYGGMLGVQTREAVVPWTILRPRREDGQYTVDLPRDRAEQLFDAVSYSQEMNLTDPQVAQRVHQQFDAQPYWEVYGYGGGSAGGSAGWGSDDEMARGFKPDQVERIRGQIISVGTFYPAERSAPGLRLRVRADDDQVLTILAGPRSLAGERGIQLSHGDTVLISGSRATISGRQGIIAQEIRSGDQTLRLFDEQGRPLWRAQHVTGERDGHYLRYRQDTRERRFREDRGRDSRSRGDEWREERVRDERYRDDRFRDDRSREQEFRDRRFEDEREYEYRDERRFDRRYDDRMRDRRYDIYDDR